MVFNQTKQGFTLIELLVVVLIIGILAAVALPQYQAAVDKAHVATYLNLAAKVRDAQNAYYLANGKYAASLDDLDLDFSVSQHCNNIVNDGTNWYAFNCKYGVGLDNTSGGKEKVFSIFFCPSQVNKTNTTYVNCWSTYSAYISFYYNTHDEAGKTGCISKDKRGARICSQFD